MTETDDVIAATSEQSVLDGRRSLHEHIARLRECIELHPENPQLSYAVGLCWYNMPGAFEEDVATQARQWMERTLTLAPNHHHARLYLGHVCFDTGAWPEAVETFSRVPNGFFGRIGQRWRDLKLAELTFCARLKANPTSISVEDFRTLADRYLAADEVDRPMPEELVRSIESMREDPSSKVPAWLEKGVTDLLSSLEVPDSF